MKLRVQLQVEAVGEGQRQAVAPGLVEQRGEQDGARGEQARGDDRPGQPHRPRGPLRGVVAGGSARRRMARLPASARVIELGADVHRGHGRGAPPPGQFTPPAAQGPARAGTADSLRGREHALLHSWPGPRPRLRRAPPPVGGGRPRADRARRARSSRIPHGTTVVAVRYLDGVVLAGDRRATSGNLISHRSIEKVFPADQHSGVAIAGAAGPGHRDGQAVPAPARALREGRGRGAQPRGQGQPARPDGPQPPAGGHAGPRGGAAVRRLRRRRSVGRLFQYDVTGGRYEEHEIATTGSGSLHAGTVLKLGWPRTCSATPPSTWPSPRCSPRPTRTPPRAAPTSSGASTRSSPPSPPRGSAGSPTPSSRSALAPTWSHEPCRSATAGDLTHGLGGAPMSMPFYVAPEQVMKDRADYARKGIARGRSLVALIAAPGILICAENPSNTLRKVSEIYDRIAFGGVGKYNEFDQLRIAGVRHADLQGLQLQPRRRRRAQPRQPVRADPGADLHPRDEAHGGRDPRRRGRRMARAATSSSTSSTTAPSWTRPTSACSAATPTPSPQRLKESWRPDVTLAEALGIAAAALAGPERTLGADDLEVALLSRDGERRAFRRLADADVASMLASLPPAATPAVAAEAPSPPQPLRPTTHQTARATVHPAGTGRVRPWSDASSGSRTSTGSPARCAGNDA